ncbi:adenylate/guanylate cyclase domain-containing protein [Rhizobium sp. CC-YZS058]|uniref:adenylate/guanylate cyclase domain-containing protein n=1 Tax=Rhizobium sp. CC-YZS058 TaxID=3042153 RepID=UPI002B056DE6|nr:adenylate/guanylate cyclase domain-containing protein [Rhizobium sp. CC-YZS058]MEA3534023.1 adenylate/guanylate cyclase domain-containing protein [Rhizobium sp. CC-YZS058]
MPFDPTLIRKRLHLWSGLFLGFFVLTHLLNHTLGLISVDAMEWGRALFNLIWRTVPGTIALYGALMVHFVMALESLYRRQTLRMPVKEAAKIILGLTLPFLLITHVTGTRIDWMLSGYSASYYDILPTLWSRWGNITSQTLALIVAWLHGCLGIWFWIRGRDWYPRAVFPLFTLALLLPLLAWLGFAIAARSLPPSSPSVAWFMKGRTDPALLAEIREGLRLFLALAIGAVLVARAWPVNGRIRIRYPDGRSISVARGFSLLEASRSAGIPHVAVCGGRGRCSTCRVRITDGLDGQPPPEAGERATLARIKAPADVRLGCQMRPNHDLSIAPVLAGEAVGIRQQTTEEEAAGRERPIAVLFCDLRDFTRMSQQQLPFDTVFLLNRYFETIGEAVESAGGVIDKFIGDGVLAIFGLASDIEQACSEALVATTRIARRVEVLNQTFTTELDRPLRIAMGMHAGTAIIGQIGYGRASSLTAVGDTINAASRLEGFAKEYDAQLAVSAETVRLAGLAIQDWPSYDIAIRGRSGTLETLIIEKASDLEPLIVAARRRAAHRETA